MLNVPIASRLCYDSFDNTHHKNYNVLYRYKCMYLNSETNV